MNIINGLKESEQRLQKLLTEGNNACSRYDLMMGYDAKFNIELVKNHISYYKNKLNNTLIKFL